MSDLVYIAISVLTGALLVYVFRNSELGEEIIDDDEEFMEWVLGLLMQFIVFCFGLAWFVMLPLLAIGALLKGIWNYKQKPKRPVKKVEY